MPLKPFSFCQNGGHNGGHNVAMVTEINVMTTESGVQTAFDPINSRCGVIR